MYFIFYFFTRNNKHFVKISINMILRKIKNHLANFFPCVKIVNKINPLYDEKYIYIGYQSV